MAPGCRRYRNRPPAIQESGDRDVTGIAGLAAEEDRQDGSFISQSAFAPTKEIATRSGHPEEPAAPVLRDSPLHGRSRALVEFSGKTLAVCDPAMPDTLAFRCSKP